LENPPPPSVQIVGKMPKAHAKGVVDLQFVYNGAQVALCSVGHDSIKMWTLNDMQSENIVVFTEANEYTGWRCGVQAAHTLPNAMCTGVIGADSMIYSLEADDEGSHIRAYDMGYMEVWHLAVVDAGRFITTSFTGFLSEVIDGKFGIREPYPKIKSVTCMSLSPSTNLLVLGNTEGAVDIVDTKTLKSIHSFEAHSMRISSVLFLSDEQLLTGSTDKYIKYFKVSSGSHSLERTMCGHRGVISCIVPGPAIEGQAPKVASASVNGQVILWNLDMSEALAHIEVPHEGSILALAFSPCGQFLVSGGDDRLLAVYRVADEPVDESAPLLNSGMELMDEMNNGEGEKQNEEPRREEEMRQTQIQRSDEEMEVDEDNDVNGTGASARDLFGDSSDSDGGGRKDRSSPRREEEEEEEEEGGYEGYGREREEEEGNREEDDEENGRRGGGEYAEEEREEEGQQEDDVAGEADEREDEESEDGMQEWTYIPSAIKKEEETHDEYGDGDTQRHNEGPRTPDFDEE
ncbi:hypothetical protein PFISCL1PPCAC_20077, partial [Pristionchus fissidentatus]